MFSSNASQVSSDANYIESCFSTYLYTSTSGTDNQIVNGIDLSGKGGLVWIKSRTRASTNHYLVDTVRGSSLGVSNTINSNTTNAQATGANLDWVQFNNNGFTAKAVTGGGELGTNTYYGDMVAWTFRKQPKFFDVVTWTGNGVDPRNIAHNLGSVPGSIIIKCTSTGATDWFVYHRSLGNSQSLNLNQTAAAETGTAIWGTTTPTSTVFTVGNINANTNGSTYVAYLFAHDAGGFGLSGNENVVSCGSVSASGVTAVTLGYEPQWLLMKRTDSTAGWFLTDTMRGWSMTSWPFVQPDTSGPEYTGVTGNPTATGFTFDSASLSGTGTYIYIAIRRGPMKVPELGTTVYNAIARTGTEANAQVTGVGFPPDIAMIMAKSHSGYSVGASTYDRLRGATKRLGTASIDAEVTDSTALTAFNMNGVTLGSDGSFGYVNAGGPGIQYINWFFRRAPGFMDIVCYNGTGAFTDQKHNLGVVPELSINKKRNSTSNWTVYTPSLSLQLNTTSAAVANPFGAVGTSSVFYPASDESGATYVNYLFATCAGVSKVGSYTGTGTTQAIACGFTAGARFVMIKRTDDVGDWYVWDSARGIVAGNDPYLLLNSTAAETTGTDYIDPSSAGFEISSTAPAAINASGGSYIFLAVA